MILTPALKMEICRMMAAAIVSHNRAQCPAGFDPKMSGIATAIIGTVATVGSAAYSISSAEKAKKQQKQAMANAEGQFAGNPLGEVPEPALYEPVDFNDAQIQAINGNFDAMPFIRQLLSQSNNFVTKDAINRAQKLIPGYSQSMATLGDSTLDLLGGKLPFDDVLGIVGDRAATSGGLNIPGLAGPATLKDLGISRLDALGKGAGLLGQMVSMAETVSPRSTYGKPSDYFMSPLDRVRLEMEQHQLQQQSQQNANNLEAGADPNDVARLQLGLNNSLMPQGQGANYAQAAQQIIQAAGGLYGAGANQGWWGTPTANRWGGYNTEAAAMRVNPASIGAPGLDVTGAVQVPGQGWQPAVRPEIWYGQV